MTLVNPFGGAMKAVRNESPVVLSGLIGYWINKLLTTAVGKATQTQAVGNIFQKLGNFGATAVTAVATAVGVSMVAKTRFGRMRVPLTKMSLNPVALAAGGYAGAMQGFLKPMLETSQFAVLRSLAGEAAFGAFPPQPVHGYNVQYGKRNLGTAFYQPLQQATDPAFANPRLEADEYDDDSFRTAY